MQDQNKLMLPALREDLTLLPGPRHLDGSPSWRIHDPVRNQFFEIGWLEFELLSRWTAHREATTLIDQVAEETTLIPTDEEIKELVEFLSVNQLLDPSNYEVRRGLRRRMQSKVRPWYETLLHHYLFFRVPLVRPDAFLQKTLPLVEVLFTRWFAYTVFVVFLADLYMLLRDWQSFSGAFARHLNLTGALYYALAATFAKVIHELAHGYVAKHNGVRIPAMGVAFLVMWPYLYTDTAETWKLSDRRKQLAIAIAGTAAELVLAVFATLLWGLSADGAFKDMLFVLATTTWVMTLAINASPFMRFDGYFVLSDAIDFPNLHERATACAQWFLRATFFQLPGRNPEPLLTRRQRGLLIAFALVTWVYRLTVYLGIALLVYHIVLKLLGIFLMLVELVWFVLRPFASEAAFLWSKRRWVRLAWRPTAVLFVALGILFWSIPVSREVTAPAVLHAQTEQAIYAPMEARLRSLRVKPGQEVAAGVVLAILDAPELAVRGRQADLSIASFTAELQRAAASSMRQEQLGVLQEGLAEAYAKRQSVLEETARLELRAPFSGRVRDLPPDIVEGRWVNPRQLLMRIVTDYTDIVEVYVSESQVGGVQSGQSVRFYPSVSTMPVMHGVVTSVDKTPSRGISRPLLASVHGGGLAAVKDRKEGLIAYDPVFRVLVRPSDNYPSPGYVLRGTARIETDLRLVAQNFYTRIISILIRESGF